MHVLNDISLPALNEWQQQSPCVNVAEINISDSVALYCLVLRNINEYGSGVHIVHNNVFKRQIFNQRRFAPLVGSHKRISTSGKLHANTLVAIGHYDIGKNTVSDHAVIGPGNADTASIASQIAVGNRHPFTNFVLLQGTVICPYDNAIIAGFDITV